MKVIQYYHSPIGPIGIIEEEQAIARILYPGEILEEVVKEEETSLLKEAKKQMEAYFANQLQQFDLPLRPVGTPFMQEVWKALLDIPYGELRSYKDIAEAVGRDKAYRAVGLANNRNPIPIIIPCHRVVGANGKLVGYGGGLEIKELLIELEQKGVRD